MGSTSFLKFSNVENISEYAAYIFITSFLLVCFALVPLVFIIGGPIDDVFLSEVSMLVFLFFALPFCVWAMVRFTASKFRQKNKIVDSGNFAKSATLQYAFFVVLTVLGLSIFKIFSKSFFSLENLQLLWFVFISSVVFYFSAKRYFYDDRLSSGTRNALGAVKSFFNKKI